MIRRNLTVGLAYFFVGKIALLLAIPPGYATAVWPSAGIALVAVIAWGPRVWPGILLGSLANNLATAVDGHALPELASAAAIAGAIAIGAVLQALLGADLIRRRLPQPLTLERERDIGELLLLGGPAACLLNATIGSSVLVATGSVTWNDLPFTWWTWWVGDTIGVLVVLPVALVWLAAPRRPWRARWAFVTLPLVGCLALVVVGFVYASHREAERLRADFRTRASYQAAEIQSELAAYLEILHGVQRFVATVPELDRAAFAEFTAEIFRRHGGLEALEWIPRVRLDQRAPIERSAKEQGLTGYRIVERSETGELVPAAARPEYFPVHFIAPTGAMPGALGYDLGSERVRREALERARDTGDVSATARVQLIVDRDGRFGTLLFAPVYARGEAHASPEARRAALRGFVLAVFRLSDMVDDATQAHSQRGVLLELVDVSDARSPAVLCAFRDGVPVTVGDALPWVAIAVIPLELGGRKWQLRFAPSDGEHAPHRSWSTWSVLAGGMLFASLLGAFLLAVTGRHVATARLVHERTQALSRSEWYLRQILKTATDAFVAIDQAGMVLQWNPRAEQIFGWTAEEVLDRPLADLIVPRQHRAGHAHGMAHFLATGEGPLLDRVVELEALHKDGRVFPVELAISAARDAEDWHFHAFLRDISQRKENERQLMSSLAEKEVLLGEIRERAGSELAMISTIVSLRRGRGDADRVVELDALRARLAIISVIQAKVHASRGLARPGFDTILRDLIAVVQERFPTKGAVQVQVVGDDLALRLDLAVACGLICAELVANALAHGYPSGRAGTVRVELLRHGEQQATLTVTDNGTGMSEAVDVRSDKTLGFQIVCSLADRFGGSFEVEQRGGSVARVTFTL